MNLWERREQQLLLEALRVTREENAELRKQARMSQLVTATCIAGIALAAVAGWWIGTI